MQGSSYPAAQFDEALQLHMDGRAREAEAAYRELLVTAPDDSRVHHLLGRLLHGLGRSQEAIHSLRTALEITPEDSQAINDLALILQETGALDESATCFRKLIESNPDDAQAWNNLGIVLKSQGRVDVAVASFEKAALLDPANVESRCNLGHAYMSRDMLAEAETVYREVIAINPQLLHVYPRLAAALRRQGRLDKATDIFFQWLKYEPENPIARHLHATCRSAETPARASSEYVRAVFDEFAETYDQHLAKLDNQGPKLISQALSESPLSRTSAMHVLDAGCGSGLCASLLRPFARTLVGVDLSSKMLDLASNTGLYDDLVEADVVEFLQSPRPPFHLIVASDMFGYFGDLQPAFNAVRNAMSSQGLLICTIETISNSLEDSGGFSLLSTGRYCHTQEYLETALSAAGLYTHHSTTGMLRREAGQPVSCTVVTAQPAG